MSQPPILDSLERSSKTKEETIVLTVWGSKTLSALELQCFKSIEIGLPFKI